jgi:hypothetical protein
MFHPVGDLAPSVYWRRRLLILAALALAVLSVYALLTSGGGGKPTADGGTPTPGTSSSSSSPRTSRSDTSSASVSEAASTATAPKKCVASQLNVAAGTDAASYPVGAKPKVALLVTNEGPRPCVADLADKQIELRVYSGSARVWGSHDCVVQPGSSPQTLPVGQPIRRDIEWSGLSSQPGCASVRQRVPAGRYTLVALLGGKQGAPATFTFTGG